MSKTRGLARPPNANPLPYGHKAKAPLQPPSPIPISRSRKGFYIASALFVYATTTYTVYIYRSLLSPPDDPAHPVPPQDTDLSSRYNETASTFDQNISFLETTTGITRLRKKIASQARGHVLEISCGTGRNSIFYDLGKVQSLTFVDQSPEMVEVAKRKWRLLHPGYENARFVVQDAGRELPPDVVPKGGYDTVVQTMGVCSVRDPGAVLRRVSSYVRKGEGRVLLVEHGRSGWGWVNWVLDRVAGRHAVSHGCWPNRDIAEVLGQSELVVEKVEKSGFGTVWAVFARPGGELGKGEGEAKGRDENGVD